MLGPFSSPLYQLFISSTQKRHFKSQMNESISSSKGPQEKMHGAKIIFGALQAGTCFWWQKTKFETMFQREVK